MEPLFSKRLEDFRCALTDRSKEAFLVSKPQNLRYLTGFTGDSSWLVITQDEQTLITDGRYTAQAKQQCPDWRVQESNTGLIPALTALQESTGFRELAFDHLDVTMEFYQRLNLALGAKVELKGEADPCYRLRRIKDEWEIRQIQEASSIADQALALLIPKIKPGVSEKYLALELYYELCKLGGEGTSFSTILAAGPQGAWPHAQPTDYSLRQGDFVTVDFGTVVAGYCSDTTRTFILGKADPLQAERYQIVLAAHNAALAGIKPGASTRAVDLLARDILTQAGYGEQFNHSLGHSVGLEVHEDPRFSQSAEDVLLEQSMVMTVEPGIYFPGWGGIRIEDSVLVTKDSVKSFVGYPKTLEEMTII
ncbi:MAG: Xaa-Pro peptidase family protein [Peptococcaceae bacterium]|nr:Xaa-Pro peptidase family protein [Peptococcaceae bacterium]